MTWSRAAARHRYRRARQKWKVRRDMACGHAGRTAGHRSPLTLRGDDRGKRARSRMPSLNIASLTMYSRTPDERGATIARRENGWTRALSWMSRRTPSLSITSEQEARPSPSCGTNCRTGVRIAIAIGSRPQADFSSHISAPSAVESRSGSSRDAPPRAVQLISRGRQRVGATRRKVRRQRRILCSKGNAPSCQT